MAIITISREYGAGGGAGNEIAARICDILGYQYFDKRLMVQLARSQGLTEEEVVDFSAETYQVRSFLDRLPGRRGARVIAQVSVWRGSVGGREVREMQQLDETYGISLAQSTIRAAYEHGNVVVVGRGGQIVLKDKSDVLHIRLEAPRNIRIQRVQEAETISPEEAEEKITQRDRAAADYLKRFYDIDWSDSKHYDLVINTGKWGIEAATRLIVNAVAQLPQIEEAEVG